MPTASLAGAAAYVPLNELAQANLTITVVPMALVFAVRLAAIRYGIHRSPFNMDMEA